MNKRKKLVPAEDSALTSQVDRVCPLCSDPLYNKKKGRYYKNYEIAHIYPLNPTKEEIALLKHEERLYEVDVNDVTNLIPLCLKCHNHYDNFKTVEEYRNLVAIKKELMKKDRNNILSKQYSLEDEIIDVMEALYKNYGENSVIDAEFDAKRVDDKLNDTITIPTRRKIQDNVNNYYHFIKDRLSELDRVDSGKSEVIRSQVKSFYAKQAQIETDQQIIFENIVDWVSKCTRPRSIEAAEIVTSFFVQSCEVF